MGKTSKHLSIIGEDMHVEGKIRCGGQLVVKGCIEGTLTADTVVVAREGEVLARTCLNRLIVSGVFDGELHASEELVVLSGGRCTGAVTCRDLVVEPGGILNADVKYRKPADED